MPNSLGSQADVAPFHVFFDVMTKRRPVVLSGDELAGLIDAEVARQRIVVMATDQLRSDDFRYEG